MSGLLARVMTDTLSSSLPFILLGLPLSLATPCWRVSRLFREGQGRGRGGFLESGEEVGGSWVGVVVLVFQGRG